MVSIRRDIVLVGGVATTVLMAGLAVLLYLLVCHRLEQQFNDLLAAQLNSAATAMDIDSHGHIHFSQEAVPEGAASSVPGYVEVWDRMGHLAYKSAALGKDSLLFERPQAVRIVFKSEKLQGGPLVREALTTIQGDSEDDQDGHGGQDRRARASAAVVVPRAMRNGQPDRRGTPVGSRRPARRDDYIIGAADSLEPLRATEAMVGGTLGLGCGGAAVACVLLLGLVVSRGLAPVRRIAASIAAVGVRDLADRVEMRGVPRELIPIVHRLNELLARIQAALAREKQLTADMAHELRTPLAGLRTNAEVALTRARSPQEYRDTLRKSLAISVQMQEMMENLLTLARLESGHWTAALQDCRLDEVLSAQLERVAGQIQQCGVTLQRSDMPAAIVRATPELLVLAIRNVVDNAVSYVNRGGTIRVHLATAAETLKLELANTGSRIAAADAPRVFERFWRGDTARTQQGLHSGLGLAIVKNIMTRWGGAVLVESTQGGWFSLQLLFPVSGKLGATACPEPGAATDAGARENVKRRK